MIKKIFLIILMVVGYLILANPVFAQVTSSGIGVKTPIESDSVVDGSIVCSGKSAIVLCDLVADSAMFGVVSDKPAAAFDSDIADKAYLVVSSGKAKVRVKGVVKSGNLLTSSDIAGVAIQADRNGYMLGTALEDFTPNNPDDQGSVLVSINIHPTNSFTNDRSNLLEVLRQGLAAPLLTPLSALRYVLAALVTITSFVLAFVYFGRLAKTAVEAIGRNPLAHKTIQATVFVHIIITLIIAGAGLLIAYLILSL